MASMTSGQQALLAGTIKGLRETQYALTDMASSLWADGPIGEQLSEASDSIRQYVNTLQAMLKVAQQDSTPSTH